MPIPKKFGISKIGLLRGQQDSRYQGRESSNSSNRQKRDAQLEQLSFELNSANNAAALLHPPSFNVLYVTTPKIAILQTSQFRAAAELWQETVELVKPMLRFGLPETSLRTKCSYYDDKLYAGSSGFLLANDRTRTVMYGVHQGYLGPKPHRAFAGHHATTSSSSSSLGAHPSPEVDAGVPQQQQQQQRQRQASGGLFGICRVASLAKRLFRGRRRPEEQQGDLQEQRQQQLQSSLGVLSDSHAGVATARRPHASQHEGDRIPHSKFLVQELPKGSLVLTLNLMAYWAITGQSRRSSMGGAMPG